MSECKDNLYIVKKDTTGFILAYCIRRFLFSLQKQYVGRKMAHQESLSVVTREQAEEAAATHIFNNIYQKHNLYLQ